MLNFQSQRPARVLRRFNPSRLPAGRQPQRGAVGLSLANLGEACVSGGAGGVNCILLFLVGGPSQLDTWDLKPDAPSNGRGPFRPIRTNVPGVEILRAFPLDGQDGRPICHRPVRAP